MIRMDKSLDLKLDKIRNGNYQNTDFIIADAKDEREFFDNLSKLLLSQIRENGKAANGNFQITLRQWLEQGTDIVCKLRGYKAETVRERRVFIAGEAEPRNEDMVAEIDEWAKEEEQ